MADILQQHHTEWSVFIFTDSDIQYFEDKHTVWEEMLQSLHDTADKDIFFMQEHERHELNTGFYAVKASAALEVAKWLMDCYHANGTWDAEHMPFGDQSIMNDTRHHVQNILVCMPCLVLTMGGCARDRMRYALIPRKYYVWGRDYHSSNASTYLFHHAVCTKVCTVCGML